MRTSPEPAAQDWSFNPLIHVELAVRQGEAVRVDLDGRRPVAVLPPLAEGPTSSSRESRNLRKLTPRHLHV